ncbi:peptidoglycan DD-metalloendopeptidase family protein [Phyllobacterium lublinensis]|uniref:peptidoglycan DD-metalloendopeptidase family protein n=1 Tax=Phyllobacterium lublinensis TaxID=2875708 RepID=UPI001CCD4748|nr:peptidoglycan DD-metalloendopeptidase family protein [Phyllobacterium sp. 2063]MBZ9653605.1 peptidoglycan DD-metalloendopeptidase family protein [Phyllobacterium sp. 2063]
MRLSTLNKASRRLALNAAILTIAVAAAGCSSGVQRFTSADFSSGYSDNQRSIMQAQNTGPQPYTPPVDSTQTASVSRGGVQRSSLPPVGAVSTSSLPPVSSEPQRPALAPVANAAPSRSQQMASAEPVQARQAAPLGASSGTLKTPDGREAKMSAQAAPSNGAAVLQAPQAKEKPASAAAKNTAQASSGGSYTVQSGDTLHAISRKTGSNVEAIKQANNMTDGTVRIGQSLIIPPSNAALAQNVANNMKAKGSVDQVKTASTPLAEQPKVVASAAPQTAAPSAAAAPQADPQAKPYTPPQASEKVINDAEKDVAAAPSATGVSGMRWPVRGRVVANYGKGSDGIDISVPEGTPIKAAENGVVIYSGDGLKEFGNTVLVRHDNGLVTVYGNASKLNVQRGQKVKRGEELGKSGMTGNATSPKLHFEVRKNSTPVDPTKYLES